ncbi:hypothetical protein FPRO05_01149 [Fusarium proliferatum]|uniref:Uncharacterized protein n=1 Tax=Gibberella intermedia TaxID=948311 RepID=A0A365NQ20_GIBIN|nr:hypothetical protein FPRO05_01149 [Fusarium proliferatum]
MCEQSGYKVPVVDGRYYVAQWPAIQTLRGPVNIRGCNYFTKALATVLRLLHDAKAEAVAFQKTSCWTDMTDCWKPFGCKDFLSMLSHTASLSLNVVYKFQQSPDYLEAEAWLDLENPLLGTKGTPHTLHDLARTVRETAVSMQNRVRSLTESVWEKEGGVPTKKEKEKGKSKNADEAGKEKPTVPTIVPTVDLRCIRLWCVLNTKERRKEIENPKNDKLKIQEILNAIEEDIEASYEEAGFSFTAVETKTLQLTPETEKRKQNLLDDNVPMIYSICIGLCWKDNKPQILHDSTTIGPTRERISSLPPYNEDRLRARNLHVGDADMKDWTKDLQCLSKIDEADKGIEVTDEKLASYTKNPELKKKLQIRTKQDVIQMQGRVYLATHAINRPDAQEPPAPQKLQALSLWKKEPRRDCSEHISRPFLIAKNGEIKGNGGCWMCKVLLRYREPLNDTELHDGLKESAAKKDFFNKRKEIPHSCAEVLCSKYCHIMAKDMQARNEAKAIEEKKKKEEEEEKRRRMAGNRGRGRYSEIARR